MKKRIRLIILISAMVVTLVTSIGFTLAWLTDTDTTGDINFTMGKISYTLIDQDIITTDTPVMPGQELITNGGFKLQNFSTVNSEIRVKITYNYVTGRTDDVPVISLDYKDFDSDCTSTNPLVYESKELIGAMVSNWIYHLTDKAWYYVGDSVTANPDNVGSSAGGLKYEVEKLPDGQGGTPFAFLTSLKYNGKVVGNDYQGAVLTVRIVFEAKQASYVDWVEIGSYSFTSGL